MQIFVKIGGHYFEISQFEKFVVTLGTGPEKLIFDRSLRFGGQASSENLVMDRFLRSDSKKLIKNFQRLLGLVGAYSLIMFLLIFS